MGKHVCSICEERPDNLMVSLTDPPFDALYLCLPCLPAWTATVFEQAGMPGLVFDFGDEEAAQAAQEGTEGPDVTDRAPEEPAAPVEPLGPDEEEPDEATPEEPGVLELVERAEGRRAVAPNGYRGRKREAAGAVEGDGVDEDASQTAGHHG